MSQRAKELLRQMRDRNTVMQEHDLDLLLDSAGAVETIAHKGFFTLYYNGGAGEVIGDTFTLGPVTYEFQDVPGTEAPGNIFVDFSPAAGDRGAAVKAAVEGAQGEDFSVSYDQSDISAQFLALTDDAAAFAISDTMTGALNFLTALLSGVQLQQISYTIEVPAIAPLPGVFSVPVPATWTQVRGVDVRQFSPFGGTVGQTGFTDNATITGAWDFLNASPGLNFGSVEITIGVPAFVAGDLVLVDLFGL